MQFFIYFYSLLSIDRNDSIRPIKRNIYIYYESVLSRSVVAILNSFYVFTIDTGGKRREKFAKGRNLLLGRRKQIGAFALFIVAPRHCCRDGASVDKNERVTRAGLDREEEVGHGTIKRRFRLPVPGNPWA